MTRALLLLACLALFAGCAQPQGTKPAANANYDPRDTGTSAPPGGSSGY